MKKHTRWVFASIIAVGLSLAACSKKTESAGPSTPASPSASDEKKHPLKGVIVDVVTAQRSLLVKHEDIPGLMPAMTMSFRVDDATLAAAKKGQAITGLLIERDGALWIEQAKFSDGAGETRDAR